MNDLDLLKDLRGSTPEITDAATSAARARLTAEWTGEPHAARHRSGIVRGWSALRPASRVALTGALAVTLTAGIGVAQNLGDPRTGSRPGTSIANAAALGDQAARAVENEPYTMPRSDQWFYFKSKSAGFKTTMSSWWYGMDPSNIDISESWTRVDGRAPRAVRYDNGKLRFSAPQCSDLKKAEKKHVGCAISFRPNMASVLKSLPTEPGALLRALYDPKTMEPPRELYHFGGADIRERRRPPDDPEVFDTIAVLLRLPVSPKLRAALYRALPRIPGVSVQQDVKDAAGRRGIAFACTFFGWERQMIILDPHTYRFLGTYSYAVRDHVVGRDAGTVKKGTVTRLSAQLDARIVDNAGDTR